MIDYTPERECPCGSGLEQQLCCIPAAPPVVQSPNAWKDLRATFYGVDDHGMRFVLPKSMDLEATATLRQPQQIEHVIEGVMDEICGAVRTALDSRPDETSLWLTRVQLSLYATRYHQRQFLSRMRAVRESHSKLRAKGSEKITLKFQDFPLRFELEAYLIRVKTSLDSVSGLLYSSLGRSKEKTFGEMCRSVRSGHGLPNVRRLRKLLDANAEWMAEVKPIRDNVIHKSAFDELQDVEIGVDSVGWLKVGDKEADEFAVSLWQRLPPFCRNLVVTAHAPG